MRLNFKYFDWTLLSLVAVLFIISTISLASISGYYFSKQIVWMALALLIIFLGSQVNWGWLFTQSWLCRGFYWISVGLILIPYIQSQAIRGAKSWIVIGGFQFEPSEVMKVALIIFLAGFFSRRYLAAWRTKNIFTSAFYALLPAFIIAAQPDLGSASVIVGIWASFLLMSGINKKRLAIGIIVILVMGIIAWSFFLQSYQKNRITSFISPELDPLGSSYNVIQSKIAIGSAGFLGKGFQRGTQVQLGFLPEAHSDFIFAAFVEEWGILGGGILVLTYLGLIIRMTLIGLKTRRNDLKFVVLGAGSVFLIHFFINIGSNLGLFPVTGISLPFVSYGGSNLLTSSLFISIIEHIKIESA